MKVERKAFLGQVERVKAAVATGGSIVELSHIWFDGKMLYAYNGKLGLCAPMETEFTGGVPGKLLLGLLSSGGAQEAELKADKNGLMVKIGNSRSTLAMLPIDRNPWGFPEKMPKEAFRLDVTEELLDALRRLLIIRCDKPSKVFQHGIVIEQLQGKSAKDDQLLLFAVGTNNNMLGHCRVAGSAGEMDVEVLDRAFVEQLVRLCPAGTQVFISPNGLLAETDKDGEGVRIYSNALNAEGMPDFPAKFDEFLPDAPHISLPKGLGEALDRAEILAGADDEEKRLICLTPEKGKLLLDGTFKAGEFEDELPLEGKKLPAGRVWTRIGHLRTAMAEAEEFTLDTDKGLALFGEKGFVIIIANQKREQKKEEAA